MLDNISKIKSHITQSLEDISNELIVEQQKLSTIQSAIKIQEQSLENIYGLHAELDSMDALLLAHSNTKSKLDTEIEESRLKWQQEKEQYIRLLKKEKEQLEKTRARESE